MAHKVPKPLAARNAIKAVAAQEGKTPQSHRLQLGLNGDFCTKDYGRCRRERSNLTPVVLASRPYRSATTLRRSRGKHHTPAGG